MSSDLKAADALEAEGLVQRGSAGGKRLSARRPSLLDIMKEPEYKPEGTVFITIINLSKNMIGAGYIRFINRG